MTKITNEQLDRYTIGILKKNIKKAEKNVRKWENELAFLNMLLGAKLKLLSVDKKKIV